MKTNQEWDAEEIKTPEHDRLVLWLMNKSNLKYLFNLIVYDILDIKTEVPVENQRYVGKDIIGYIDLEMEIVKKHSFTDDAINGTQCGDCGRKKSELESELKSCQNYYRKYIFEVKPKITNFGSLVRQIKKYRSFYGVSADWVVFTEDCPEEMREPILSQNISIFIFNEKEVGWIKSKITK